MKGHSRVLIFGIDGGTFDVIRPLVHRGELPNLAALMTTGASGELLSTIPPITAPAWVSFMTGKNPGKHGIFHFVGHTHSTYTGRILGAADIKARTLWSILTKQGKRLIVVNVPNTYPPTEINGVMICGLGTPSQDLSFTYPEGIYQELLQGIGDYKVECGGEGPLNTQDPSPGYLDELIENLHYMTAKRTEAVLYLMKEYDWDLCMVVYVLADRLQHVFWKFMDPSHPDHDPELAERYGRVIIEGYRKVDEAIGRILREVEDDVTVIVLSDHGFGPLHKYFFINNWLMQKGFLRLRRTLPWRFQITHPTVQGMLTKLGLGCLAQFLPEKVRRLNVPRVKKVLKNWEELIDWSRTKVYAPIPIGLNVNLQGREPNGIVRPGEESDKLLHDLVEELSSLREPETGEKVVDTMARKEEIYTGPYINESMDMLFAMKGLLYLPYLGRMHFKDLFSTTRIGWNGTHRFEGIFIMKGPKIRNVALPKGSRIIDVTPTILYLLNLPIPRDMDGEVLVEAIDPDVLAACPVTYTEGEWQEGKEAEGEVLSVEDEESVRRRLIDLGYIS